MSIDPDQWAASRERSRLRRAESTERRRRERVGLLQRAGIVLGAAVLVGVLVALFAGGGDGSGGKDGQTDRASADAKPKPLAQLPGGGRTIFPDRRVVAFYGTPGAATLGTLGAGTPDQAARRLVTQTKAYRRRGEKPPLPAFEIIATVAANAPGEGSLYRNRLELSEVRRYLRAIRKVHGLLVIDVQPGRADFMDEVKRFAPLLREPDVSLALDPEWKMGPSEIPGQVIGHTDAAKINEVSAWLAQIVRKEKLPQKILLVHLFTPTMVLNRPQLAERPGLALTLNVDGFGGRAVKKAKYRELAPRRKFFSGFKLFYTQDVDRLSPRDVYRLRPTPRFIDYQ